MMYFDDIEDDTTRPNQARINILEFTGRYISDTISEWHNQHTEYWEWDKSEPTEYRPLLAYWLEKLNYHNYTIWHAEDICRGQDEQLIVQSKRLIDNHNQARNDAIEKLNSILIENEQAESPTARYNSETIGSICDRISIIRLKFYHIVTLPSSHIDHLDKLNKLLEQARFLDLSVSDLLDEMRAGTRLCKQFLQMKQYNDPAYNQHHRDNNE